MMRLPLSPYTPHDLPDVLALVGAANASTDFCVCPHPGDVAHLISSALRDRDPAQHLWLHTAPEGTLRALVMLYGLGDPAVDVVLHPQAHITDTEEHALFAFAEAQLAALLRHPDQHVDSIGCDVLPCATARRALLEARGYTPGPPLFTLTRQPLHDVRPTPALADGYTVRAATLTDAAALGALHAAAFTSLWRPEGYARVMASHAFAPYATELVAVAPDGTLAAFAVTWHDAHSGSGLFEPVGTHPDHQRRGLAHALLAAGMQQMRAAGLHTALVRHAPGSENPAAAALYARAGFVQVATATDMRKPLAAVAQRVG